MYGFGAQSDRQLMQCNQIQCSTDHVHHEHRLSRKPETATKLPMRPIATLDLSTHFDAPMFITEPNHRFNQQLVSSHPRTMVNLSGQPIQHMPHPLIKPTVFSHPELLDWTQMSVESRSANMTHRMHQFNVPTNDHYLDEQIERFTRQESEMFISPIPGDLSGYPGLQFVPSHGLLINSEQPHPCLPGTEVLVGQHQKLSVSSPNCDDDYHNMSDLECCPEYQADYDQSITDSQESVTTTRSNSHQGSDEVTMTHSKKSKKHQTDKTASETRRRQTHSLVERKYRENLNTKMAELHNLIKASRNRSYIGDLQGGGGGGGGGGASFHGTGNSGPNSTIRRDYKMISQSPPTNQSSTIPDVRKADVLKEAIDYVKTTQIEMKCLIDEINQLKRQHPAFQNRSDNSWY